MKHPIRILLLLLLLYTSAVGSYINGGEYSTNQIFLFGTIDVIVITFIMTVTPIILRLNNKIPLEYNRGRKICRNNSIILFIMSIILTIILDSNYIGIGGLGTIMFYFINLWLTTDINFEK